MRTGGNMNGFMDLNLKRGVDEGRVAGPSIDATAPYVNGANTFLQMRSMADAAEARRQVAYWADMGATSFKAYMQISRAQLGAVVEEAHKRGLKVTGHLCSVTYAEAADLGIDNLEHGFFAATDFVTDKQPDVCPGQGRGQQTIADLDESSAGFQALVKKLVDEKVALTSTLTVFETLHAGPSAAARARGAAAGAEGAVRAELSADADSKDSIYRTLFPKAMALERAFVQRRRNAGDRHRPDRRRRRHPRLLQPARAGTAGGRRLHAARSHHDGHAERRPLPGTRGADWDDRSREAGRPGGARRRSLARDRRPAQGRPVFRQGVGYDPAKLVASVTGRVGLVVEARSTPSRWCGCSSTAACRSRRGPTLPPAVGLWHVRRFGADLAVDLLRERISRYNEAVGTANTSTSGYHETLTVFYVKVIDAFVSADASPTRKPARSNAACSRPSAIASCRCAITRASACSQPRPDARWVAPDLQPLP